MPHIHLTILTSARWSANSFSFLTGQVSLSCNTLLCTQPLCNLPLTFNDISLLVSSGTNCLNLFAFCSPQMHQHLHEHSTCHLNNKTYPLTPDLHWLQYLIYICASRTSYWNHTTSNNKWFHHFVHATFYTPTFPVYFWQLVHYTVGFIYIYSHAPILHKTLPLTKPFN